MFRIVRFPSAIDNFFRSLKTEFKFGHFKYFRMLVLLIAISWEDKNISSLYKYLDKDKFPHRTRFNNFMNIGRWEPEKALSKKAYELINSLNLKKGETIKLIIDDSKKMKRGKEMDALGWIHDPVLGKSVWGHQYVKATIRVRNITIPFAISLYVKENDCYDLDIKFHKVTELAAEMIKSFIAPKKVNVIVLFDTYYLCPAVTKVCKEKGFHFVSVLKSNRNLNKRGKKLKSGSYGVYCFKNKEKSKFKISKANGISKYTYIDTGFIHVSKLGELHLVYSRKNSERKILALVTDHPDLKGNDMISLYDTRWSIEVFFKDSKQLLGLGRYQNRSYKAAVTHLHLVCLAYALLTHIAINGICEKDKNKNAACVSVNKLQHILRGIIWNDTAQYLKELPNLNSVFKELYRLLLVA